MKFKSIFCIVTTALCINAYAQENPLSGSLDLTYMSKLMDKGGEYYGDQGGFLQNINLDLYNTGFGVAVGHRQATGGEYASTERYDSSLYYHNTLFKDEIFETGYKLAYIYHSFFYDPRATDNGHECVISLGWDKLLPLGIKPFYNMAYETPDGPGESGFWHQFGAFYDFDIPCKISPIDDSLKLRLSADIAYRDGLGGPAVDHDWSHYTLGASTTYKITENLSFLPGMFFQKSMDNSVAREDVTYASLSMKYSF